MENFKTNKNKKSKNSELSIFNTQAKPWRNFGGSLKTIPQQLFPHLNNGGRMVVVVGSEPVQHCVRVTRDGDTFSEKVLFDTLITPLQDGNNAGWYKATGKFTF